MPNRDLWKTREKNLSRENHAGQDIFCFPKV